MTNIDMVELINSLRARTDIPDTTIHAILLDVLQGSGTSECRIRTAFYEADIKLK